MVDNRLYRVINHACRACGGRILKSDPDAGGNVGYRCADCGIGASGHLSNKHGQAALCFCGARMPGSSGFILRCGVNQTQGLDMPEEVVAIGVESGPAS